MSKKGKKGKKQPVEEVEEIELAECPSCEKAIPADATTCPKCGEEFDEGFEDEEDLAECPSCGDEIPADASSCPGCGEDFDEGFEDEEEIEPVKAKKEKPKKEKTEKPKKKKEKQAKEDKIKQAKELDQPTGDVKYTLLMIGVILCLAGFIGVVGLRMGFVQSLLGDAAAYPGIGSVEPMGHVVSIIPFVIGIVTIFVWGVKNEPLYIEKDKVAEEESFDLEDEKEDIPDVPEPVADIAEPEEVEVPEEIPEEEAVDEPEDIFENIEAELDSIDDIGSEIEAEDVDASLDGLAASLAEDERISLCNDALAAADVYDDDRKNLMKLIILGLPVVDFRDKIDEAEAKKKKDDDKKKKEFQDMSPDEKGTSLEDELAAELAILEEELDDDDEDLEDRILKEIGDLEDL